MKDFFNVLISCMGVTFVGFGGWFILICVAHRLLWG